ncbi:hypothetical protein [Lysobacter claricitrinus]|uniref:hypothetical protein n=1 Tax=Lysobacter claricitrinus TaxID=3367728 RepID=UPI0037DBD2BC
MKQQLQALGSAIGMYVLSLLPFGLGYFFIAISLFSGHGATQDWYDLVGYAWLALALVIPIWVAVASYRRVMREQS